jgi:hypothetical protein
MKHGTLGKFVSLATPAVPKLIPFGIMHLTSFGLKRLEFAVRRGNYFLRLPDFFGGLTRSIRPMASSKSMSSFKPPFCFCGFVFNIGIISEIQFRFKCGDVSI